MGSGIRGNFGNTKGSKLMPLTKTSDLVRKIESQEVNQEKYLLIIHQQLHHFSLIL